MVTEVLYRHDACHKVRVLSMEVHLSLALAEVLWIGRIQHMPVR